ncbi:37231_t:CDS:2, partial [Gigaspora margarita]
LLLVDGATSYAINNLNEYPNICVHFFFPNAIAHLQPIDAGIINAFKAYYKHFYIHKIINNFNIGIKKPNKINVLQAVCNKNFENESINISEIIEAQCEAQEIIDLTNNTNL